MVELVREGLERKFGPTDDGFSNDEIDPIFYDK